MNLSQNEFGKFNVVLKTRKAWIICSPNIFQWNCDSSQMTKEYKISRIKGILTSDIIWDANFSAFSADTPKRAPNSSNEMLTYSLLADNKLCSITARSRIVMFSEVNAFWWAETKQTLIPGLKNYRTGPICRQVLSNYFLFINYRGVENVAVIIFCQRFDSKLNAS